MKSNHGAGINFTGEVVRDRDQMTANWCTYFERLYTPTRNENFDQTWCDYVSEEVNTSIQGMVPDKTAIVRPDVVSKLIENYPRGKAGGYDKQQYEHIIYAKDALSPILANVLTKMVCASYIPDQMKRGVIVTLHKAGNKRKDCPDNYHAITLIPVILKVYEAVILHRSKESILSSISPQQGGFQDGLSCLMTSFILRERLFITMLLHVYSRPNPAGRRRSNNT